MSLAKGRASSPDAGCKGPPSGPAKPVPRALLDGALCFARADAPWALLQHCFDAAHRLPDAALVFDQGEAHVVIAVIAKADAG
jgi:hypothetical protein